MDILGPEELRVLGVLVEKEATTPEQYPLTMNSLLIGCNQTSNRNPVVSYDRDTVEAVIAGLRERGLARVVHSPSNRAEKYRHVLHETWALTAGELAVLAVLALRGPQTVNELKTRTDRYPGLEEMGGVEGVLHRLKSRYEQPYVVRLDRQSGQREERWAHLLAGEVIALPDLPAPAPRSPAASTGSSGRFAELERQTAELAEEVAALRREVKELRELLD